jgi:hypothetical protein
MLATLKRIEATTLPELLRSPDAWASLDITYHPPHVERLWTTVPEGRLFLHRIEPCDPGDALVHPHDWPSAMKILSGRYEHGIGVADDNGDVDILSVAELAAGTYYEMSNPRVWHWVRPLEVVCTLMLAGPLYAERPPFAKPTQRQLPLTSARAAELLETFRGLLG